MWKKSENESSPQEAPKPDLHTPELRRSEPVKPSPTTPTMKSSGQAAVIGPSISINGDIKGEEDLIILGLVEGSLNLRNNSLTVGNQGRLTANVIANSIMVEGEVRGELRAVDYVLIKPTGSVHGDIKAPRVVLEDGCKFKGSVDMESIEKAVKPAHQAQDRHQSNRLRPASPQTTVTSTPQTKTNNKEQAKATA